MGKRAELKVLRPRLVPLDAEGEREAIALLADLLLDAAGKRRADVSSGALRGIDGRRGVLHRQAGLVGGW